MANYDYFTINFAPLTGLLFLTFFLYSNDFLTKKVKGLFYSIIALEFVELIFYSLELFTATLPYPPISRFLFSAVGYTLRPIIIYLIWILSSLDEVNRKTCILMAIPLVLNGIVAFSTFFTDIAYTYNAQNIFIRGPLGYTAHFLLVFYLLVVLITAMKFLKEKSRLELFLIQGILLLIMFSMVVEAAFDVRSIGRTSIVLSTVFYYMFFQTQDYKENLNKIYKIRQGLEKKSTIDSLTGLLNKGAFLEKTESTMQAILEESVSVVFIHLDYFKQINDKLGHLAGDEALKDVAKKIEKIFKNVDIIGRFGGDEFYLFLKSVSQTEILHMLNEALLKLRHEYYFENISIDLTVSIGCVYVTQLNNKKLNDLLKIADDALYEAKNLGRNRYILKEY